MKKLISILLVIAIAAAFVACGNKPNNENTENPDNTVVDIEKNDVDATEDELDNKAEDKKDPELAEDNKKPSAKPEENKPAKPSANPDTNKPAEKPIENKPAEKPAENKPAEKPEENKPAEKPATPTTLGGKLLAAFKANASSKSGEALANSILSIPEIEFSPVVMSVEEGMLTGFGNNEIKGFKSATTFAPMIGSIPFVGYVFELENAADTASFISTLKANANLRWNVCTEADEMITGSVGNKVFFVMCPTDFED